MSSETLPLTQLLERSHALEKAKTAARLERAASRGRTLAAEREREALAAKRALLRDTELELERERADEIASLPQCSHAVEATPAFDNRRVCGASASGSTTPDRLSHGSDTSYIVAHMAPDDEEVKRAVNAAGHAELSEDDLTLLVRALARETRMELPQHLHETGSSSGALRKTLCPLSAGLPSKLARSPAATIPNKRTSYIGESEGVQRLYSPPVARGVPVSVAMTRRLGPQP